MRTSAVQTLLEPIKKGNGTIKLGVGAMVALVTLGAGYGKLVDDVGDNSAAIVEVKNDTAEDLHDLERRLNQRLTAIEVKLDRLLER